MMGYSTEKSVIPREEWLFHGKNGYLSILAAKITQKPRVKLLNQGRAKTENQTGEEQQEGVGGCPRSFCRNHSVCADGLKDLLHLISNLGAIPRSSSGIILSVLTASNGFATSHL
jgi:hypothetical protein